MTASLSARQQRELDYHATRDVGDIVNRPVDLKIVAYPARRPWNGYWAFWDRIGERDWTGRRVLIAGSGYGEDAIRMASLGAEVTGYDLSDKSVAISRERAARAGLSIDFRQGPLERMPFDDRSFDAVLMIDILHHVEIPEAMAEICRVAKVDATFFVNEIYTHDFIDNALRRSKLVDRLIYPLLRRRIYGTDKPYITDDERKLSADDLRMIEGAIAVERRDWFNLIVGRLYPPTSLSWPPKADRLLIRLLGPLARYAAGRVVIVGRQRSTGRGVHDGRAAAEPA